MNDTEKLNKIVDALIEVLVENNCTVEEANRMLRSASCIIAGTTTVQRRSLDCTN